MLIIYDSPACARQRVVVRTKRILVWFGESCSRVFQQRSAVGTKPDAHADFRVCITPRDIADVHVRASVLHLLHDAQHAIVALSTNLCSRAAQSADSEKKKNQPRAIRHEIRHVKQRKRATKKKPRCWPANSMQHSRCTRASCQRSAARREPRARHRTTCPHIAIATTDSIKSSARLSRRLAVTGDRRSHTKKAQKFNFFFFFFFEHFFSNNFFSFLFYILFLFCFI